MTDTDLAHFVEAQVPVLDQVVAELNAGTKRTHWMWFIFPQIAGLGHSAMARHYAISDLGQARRYLADPVLGERLRHHVRLMLDHKGKSALEILGSPDDLKFRSCLTLFRAAASEESDRSLFANIELTKSSSTNFSPTRMTSILSRSSPAGNASTISRDPMAHSMAKRLMKHSGKSYKQTQDRLASSSVSQSPPFFAHLTGPPQPLFSFNRLFQQNR